MARSSLCQQILDLSAEGGSGIVVPHNQKHGVIAGQRPHYHRHIHGVHRRCSGRGQTRHGFDDANILSIVKAGDALPEDGVQPGGEGPRPILGRGGIAVCSKGGQLIVNPELLDVSGNGGLGTVKSFILERFQKLFLGLDITGRYNLHDLGMSLGLNMH